MKTSLLTVIMICSSLCPAGAQRRNLAGRVVDGQGKPVPHATVLVYHAGVKTGFSTFCPSCYVDCGKRVFTDAGGKFLIENLAPDLWFSLLAVHEGYVPHISGKADPVKDLSVTIRLAAPPMSKDFSGVVRGHVVDQSGDPIEDALIQPTGLIIGKSSYYGTLDGLEPLAVSNKNGDFELSYAKPTPKMLLNVEARALAPKFITMTTGPERHTVTLSEGSAITGRLLANGKPVTDAQIGLIPKNRGGFGNELAVIGDPYEELRIGTNANGTFTVTNVPDATAWYVYAKMQSLSAGATDPVEVDISKENDYVRAADLLVLRGYRVSGRVTLSDGKPLPPGMRITIGSDRVRDSQTTELAADGHFEFAKLPAGDYYVSPAVKGYSVHGSQFHPFDLPVSIHGDMADFVIPVFPATANH